MLFEVVGLHEIGAKSILGRVKTAAALSILVLGLALGPGSGCGGSQESPSQFETKDDASSSHGKKWGGWRWKGKRNDCFFKYKNTCYPSMAKACKAARCPKADCVHDDSAPAKVKCTLFDDQKNKKKKGKEKKD